MSVEQQIKNYISSQPEPKRSEMESLHKLILQHQPKTRFWFEDGRNSEGKIVSNPNVGYGSYTIRYADGKTREFFQVGFSANTSGISLYIMGLKDKKLLTAAFADKLPKAKITGYCIKFKTLKDVDLQTLSQAINAGFDNSLR